jgi:hypothetical protein
MTHRILTPVKADTVALYYVMAIILLVIAIAGKDVIAWILMKLYEIFIQQNPVRI